jgi:hypothetical protein
MWTPVIDFDNHCLPIHQVGYFNPCPKWQGPVGSSVFENIELFATCCPFAMEVFPIIRSPSFQPDGSAFLAQGGKEKKE